MTHWLLRVYPLRSATCFFRSSETKATPARFSVPLVFENTDSARIGRPTEQADQQTSRPAEQEKGPPHAYRSMYNIGPSMYCVSFPQGCRRTCPPPKPPHTEFIDALQALCIIRCACGACKPLSAVWRILIFAIAAPYRSYPSPSAIGPPSLTPIASSPSSTSPSAVGSASAVSAAPRRLHITEYTHVHPPG